MVRRADFNFERRDPQEANFRFEKEQPIKAIFKIAPPTVNYELLINKPKINHIELIGDKSLEDLGITTEIIDLIAQHNTSEEAHEFIRNLITQEIIDREAADLLLDGKILQEILDRKTADQTLQNNINEEAQTRAEQDLFIREALEQEARIRTEQDQRLQTNIENEAQARQQADQTLDQKITQETQARQQADTALGQRVTQETTARENADTALGQRVTQETTARENADTVLGNRITDEVSARQQADQTLQTNINNETTARENADTALGNRIDSISELIPTEATPSNKLADKSYVTYTVQTASANFRGNWATWAAVPTVANDYPEDADGNRTPTKNDYMVVNADETQDGGTWRYKYTGLWSTDGKNGWLVEYEIEKSPLTPEQQAAINSGITSELVGQITTNQGDISDINTIIGGYGDIVTHNVSEFATSAQGVLANSALQPNDNISELTNNVGYIKGITSSDVTTALGYTPYDDSNPSGYISSASMATLTDVNLTSLADGEMLTYNSATSKWVNSEVPNSAVWGGITGTLSNQTDLQSALDGKVDKLSTKPTAGTYTKVTINGEGLVSSGSTLSAGDIPDISTTYYLASNPDGYTTNVGTVTSVNNTSPDSNGNVTISIPSEVTESTVSGWGFTKNVGTVTSVNSTSPDANGNVSLTIPTINSSNNYVPYRSSATAFTNSTLMYNSSAMAFTGKLHIGSASPQSYYDKGRVTIYDNTASQQTTSLALLNYGGGGGCGVAIDMYNTSANGGIPSGKFGLVDNGNYSGYLQLQVKKSGAASNPLLPAMNVVPVPATNSLTTCISFGHDEFNRVLFDLHKPEAVATITDSDKRWGGSGTTYSVTGSNKFNPRLLVAVGDIVSFDSFATETTVTGVISNSSTCQITTDVSLGTISNKNISVKKAYFKVTDENYNTKMIIDPYGNFGIGKLKPSYELDVAGTINASTDIKINGSSLASVAKTGDYDDLINKPSVPSITFYWGE